MSEEITYASMKDVKPGRFILIDGVACRVVDVETSAPGKHGAAKMRITAIGIFDGNKKTLLKPSSGDIEIPLISKKKAQVVSITGSSAQLMNLETFETYEITIPEEMISGVKPGAEVEVMEYGEKRIISRVTGSV